MEKNIYLLDCTLREAPIDHLLWGSEFIEKVIYNLERTNIDIIEIGFLKNVEHIEGSTIFNDVEQIERYIPSKAKCQYVALVDYGRYDIDLLKPYDGKSIDGIRVCFKKEEIEYAIEYAKKIMDKGYWVSIQQVDTRGYSDEELLSFFDSVNRLKPQSYSIVDTFGSMYEEDAEYIYRLADHNLDLDIKLGFHAHNNLMLAASNSQKFISDLFRKRDLIIDGSIHGCGRGAGNAHTELLVAYLNRIYPKYNINVMLDLIDDILPVMETKSKWGYSIPYFIAGMHSAHVFNIDYLLTRHNIRSGDLTEIVNGLDDANRRKYNFPILEKLYIDYFAHEIDDSIQRNKIKVEIGNRKVLLVAPGHSIGKHRGRIIEFIEENNPYIIHLNMIVDELPYTRIFCSNQKRLDMANIDERDGKNWILTSNLHMPNEDFDGQVVDYKSLIKYGWINIDNTGILALRFLKSIGIKNVYVAGFDGYNYVKSKNYYSVSLQRATEETVIDQMNRDISEMILDLLHENEEYFNIEFITPSKYEGGSHCEESLNK